MLAYTLIRDGTKLGIAGGALYWSYQQGIWGTMAEGADAMKRLQANVITEVSSSSKQPATPVSEMTIAQTVAGAWNSGVRTVFNTASELPERTVSATQKAGESIKNLMGD